MFNKSVEYIYSLERTDKEFNLDAIQEFLNKVGNPENKLKAIHVAGTNGKGSTCAFINQSLIEAGYNVGFFSSPHLIKFNERIRVNNKEISDEDLERLTKKLDIKQKETGVQLTFFEAATVLAYWYFNEKKVDYAVLEVGLGGRLDATNTCKPIISVITSIGFDHMEMLGNTLELITKEKAGIIKPGVKVVTAVESIDGIRPQKIDLEIGLKGDYQKENAALAFTVLKELNIDEESIKRGLKNTKWKGRFEYIDSNILVDCAHNEQGINAMVDSVKKLNRNIILIFGVCNNKDVLKMSKKLKELKPIVILTRSKVNRAADPNKLMQYFENAVIKDNVKEALEYAKSIQSEDLILVSGSIYLIGEVYL
ncbi:MAG: folylpolyglutamate synthase/dihydrofolate synthase family protein [archaeon]